MFLNIPNIALSFVGSRLYDHGHVYGNFGGWMTKRSLKLYIHTHVRHGVEPDSD